jgi:hypothetical protein
MNHLVICRGDTCRRQFVLWTDEDKTQPVDLTDVDVRSEVRDREGHVATLICNVTLPNVIDVAVDTSVSESLTRATWSLRLIYPSGDVATVWRATLDVAGTPRLRAVK